VAGVTRNESAAILLVAGFVAGLWLLLALRFPDDVIRLYVVSPILLIFGLIGIVNGLAWIARRLGV
jgi:hypothetical protein